MPQEKLPGQIIRPDSRASLANPDYVEQPFTDFANVTPATPLEQLNLNWRECDLPERERTKHVHRLHPYLGKFIPQLVEIFLRKYTPQCVLDPFMGSGTTLVEATALDIPSVGCDISPFNCLLAKVKTDNYRLDLLNREARDILIRSGIDQRSLFSQDNTPEEDVDIPEGYLREWYAERAAKELVKYCQLIPQYTYQHVLQIILSRSARSARLTTHYELDFPKQPQQEPYYCRKHHRICKPTDDAAQFLRRYTEDTVKRIRQFAIIRGNVRPAIICGDSREVSFPNVDLVVTSPPYVGLIDYHRQHIYAYHLFRLLPAPFRIIGWDGKDLLSNEKLEIGPASGGQSKAAKRAYQQDMLAVFDNCVRSLEPGGHIVVVINDKHGLYKGMARKLGLLEEAILTRHVNRRTGRRNGAFFEQVIIWRKPI